MFAVRRGLRMLNCEIISEPVAILNKFPQYYKKLIDLFFNTENGSLYHAATTPNIIKYAKIYMDKLTFETKNHLFDYFLECCRHCLSNDTAFYLSLEVYDINLYSGLIEQMIKDNVDIFYKLSLPDIVTLIKCDLCTSVILNNMQHIYTLKEKEPEYAAQTFLSLLISYPTNQIVIQTLKQACSSNSLLLNYLPTNIALLSVNEKEFMNLLTNHSKISNPLLKTQFASEDSIIKLCKSPINVILHDDVIVEQVQQSPVRFSPFSPAKITNILDQANEIHHVIESQSPFNQISKIISAASRKVKIEAKKLPDNHKFSSRLRTQSSIVMTPKVLHAYGVKKGGIGHSSWQKRYFEFYQSAKCVFWREMKTSKHIRGVIVLSNNAKIIPNISHKGFSYHLLIELGEGIKTYDIAFEDENVCNQWCQALQSVVTEL